MSSILQKESYEVLYAPHLQTLCWMTLKINGSVE